MCDVHSACRLTTLFIKTLLIYKHSALVIYKIDRQPIFLITYTAITIKTLEFN